jgi:hypothetical protein
VGKSTTIAVGLAKRVVDVAVEKWPGDAAGGRQHSNRLALLPRLERCELMRIPLSGGEDEDRGEDGSRWSRIVRGCEAGTTWGSLGWLPV